MTDEDFEDGKPLAIDPGEWCPFVLLTRIPAKRIRDTILADARHQLSDKARRQFLDAWGGSPAIYANAVAARRQELAEQPARPMN
jgi:hypothetical protein